ncbi:MAG: type II toxin-antitoxin system VapC family toxin [Bdellovibrionales bacterium]
MNKVLLDSSALLALIHREKGAELVEPFLGCAVMSAVNYAEVLSKLMEKGVPDKEAITIVRDLLQEVIPFDEQSAAVSGRLRSHTKSLGLSLGDRACLATAEVHELEVLTADKVWAKVKAPVKIKCVR